MSLSTIDFNALYKQQKLRSTFKPKNRDDWEKKAKSVSQRVHKSIYNSELLSKMDFTGCSTLLDVGCGAGNIAILASKKVQKVYALDFSKNMLKHLKEEAKKQNIDNITTINVSWEDNWDDIPTCDVVLASRSMEVSDMKDALKKLNKKAKKRVYLTYKVGGSFVNDDILEFIGKKIVKKPDFIYIINILFQMGIYSTLSYIKSEGRKKQYDSLESFKKSIIWSIGEISREQEKLLEEYYDTKLKDNEEKNEYVCWAVISWDKKSQPCL